MSIQSSINSLLATSAVLTKLAQPNINAQYIAREKKEERDAFIKQDRDRIEKREGLAPDQLLNMLSGELAYDEDYLNQLQALHEMSPGNEKITNEYGMARADTSQYHAKQAQNFNDYINDEGQSLNNREKEIKGFSDKYAFKKEFTGKGDNTFEQTLSEGQQQLLADRKMYDALKNKYQTYRNQALGMATRGVIKNG